MADDKITFIRGADGTLYALTDTQLTAFKVEKQKEVDEILDEQKENVKTSKLPDNVVKQIQAANGCVKTTAQAPEVYTNTKK